MRRPCLERVSTKAFNSSRMAVSSSILVCREVKIAGSTFGEEVEAAGLVIAASSDILRTKAERQAERYELESI